jgi:hypothetical protein
MVTYSIPPDLLSDASEQNSELKKYLKFSLAVATSTAIKRVGMLKNMTREDSQDFAILMYVASFFDVMLCQDTSGALTDADKAFLRKFNRILLRYMFTVEDDIVAASKAVWDRLCTTDCMSEGDIKDLVAQLPGLLSDGLKHHEDKLVAFMQGMLSHPAMLRNDTKISIEAIRKEILRVQGALPRIPNPLTQKAALEILDGVPEILRPVVRRIQNGEALAGDIVAPEGRKEFKMLVSLYELVVKSAAPPVSYDVSYEAIRNELRRAQAALPRLGGMTEKAALEILGGVPDFLQHVVESIRKGGEAAAHEDMVAPEARKKFEELVKLYKMAVKKTAAPPKSAPENSPKNSPQANESPVTSPFNEDPKVTLENLLAMPTSDLIKLSSKLKDIIDTKDASQIKQFLNLPETATQDDVKKWYKRTLLSIHPDKVPPGVVEDQVEALKGFVQVFNTLNTHMSIFAGVPVSRRVSEIAQSNDARAAVSELQDTIEEELKRLNASSAEDALSGVPREGPLRFIMTRVESGQQVNTADLLSEQVINAMNTEDLQSLAGMLSKLAELYRGRYIGMLKAKNEEIRLKLESKKNAMLFMEEVSNVLTNELTRVKEAAPSMKKMSVDAAWVVLKGAQDHGVLKAIMESKGPINRHTMVKAASSTNVNPNDLVIPEKMIRGMKELATYYTSASSTIAQRNAGSQEPKGPNYDEGVHAVHSNHPAVQKLHEMLEDELDHASRRSAFDVLTSAPRDGPLRTIMARLNNNQAVSLSDLVSRDIIDTLENADRRMLEDTLSRLVVLYRGHIETDRKVNRFINVKHEELRHELERVKATAPSSKHMSVADAEAILVNIPSRGILNAIRTKKRKEISRADYITNANANVNPDNIKLHATPPDMDKIITELSEYYRMAKKAVDSKKTR